MDFLNFDPSFFPAGNMRINNARVEEVFCNTPSGGSSVLISYSNADAGRFPFRERLRLNIDRNTIIRDTRGRGVCACCLQPGALISAVVSSRTTRSIPPQANAFLILVWQNTQPPQPPQPPWPPQPPRPPQEPSSETVGRIILVDFDQRYLITEAPRNRREQIRFNTTGSTTYANRFGRPMRFEDLSPGQTVRITHAAFMTPSIPPQTTAFHIRQL